LNCNIEIWITNRYAALENVSEDEDINGAWESIKENIKTSATEGLVCMKGSSINHGLMRNV
jgi:hypothetical protein